MFRSFLDHLQVNIFQQKVQSVRTIRYGIPYCLQIMRTNNYKVFLNLKHCWTGCSASETLCRCLLSVMKALSLQNYVNYMVY